MIVHSQFKLDQFIGRIHLFAGEFTFINVVGGLSASITLDDTLDDTQVTDVSSSFTIEFRIRGSTFHPSYQNNLKLCRITRRIDLIWENVRVADPTSAIMQGKLIYLN